MTYGIAAEFLRDCSFVEDWGCGMGWMRTLVSPERYRGIDGTKTPFSDAVVDLVKYRSKVSAVFMRHVLEHNYRWADILDNALASFKEALAIEAHRSITADDTVNVLESIVAARGASPEFIRMDNGPELTAHALQDWCRFSSS